MEVEDQIYNIINLPFTYIGECPVDVNDCQWIRVVSGVSRVYFKKDTYDKLDYSIYVRGMSNEETYNRMKSIYDALKNYVGQNCSILISRLPHYAGKDDLNRNVYYFQLEYQKGGY